MIKREEVFAVIDEIVPEYERGAKVRHINSSFSRAYGESRLRECADRFDLCMSPQ